VATEAAWLSGKKWKKSRKEQKKLLTGIGLLMEGPTLSDPSSAESPLLKFFFTH
jgi:hypothetical protein